MMAMKDVMLSREIKSLLSSVIVVFLMM